jgi:hypothetical protein
MWVRNVVLFAKQYLVATEILGNWLTHRFRIKPNTIPSSNAKFEKEAADLYVIKFRVS